MEESVIIVGAGNGLSASLARLCTSQGMKVILAARDIVKLKQLKKEIGAYTIKCDSTNVKSVENLFKKSDKILRLFNFTFMIWRYWWLLDRRTDE